MEHNIIISAKLNLLSKNFCHLLYVYCTAAVFLRTKASREKPMKSIVFHDLPCVSSGDIVEICKVYDVQELA